MNKIMQSGRSMMEMLGVLAIIGVLSVGGFSMVGKMQTSHISTRIQDEITSLASKARMFARDYEGNDINMTAEMVKAKSYPDTLTLYDKKLTGTDDVQYTVNYAKLSGNGDLFEIKVEGVSEDVCMQLATVNWGSVSSSGVRQVKIGNTASQGGVFSISSASSSCASSNNTRPDITFYFR